MKSFNAKQIFVEAELWGSGGESVKDLQFCSVKFMGRR